MSSRTTAPPEPARQATPAPAHRSAGGEAAARRQPDQRPSTVAQRQLLHAISHSSQGQPPVQQLKGKVSLHDAAGLEREADVLERKALSAAPPVAPAQRQARLGAAVVQREAAGIDTTGSPKLTGRSDKAKTLGIQKTQVDFATDKLTSTGEEVGVKMVAHPLGPDHPQGSMPDTAATAKHINYFNQHDKYIRGHLLNGNIGGPGKAENLFPITAQANALHYQKIEKIVENWVNGGKFYVHYEVEVKNRDDSQGKADFYCQAYPLDGAGKQADHAIQAVIHSEPSSSASKDGSVLGTKGTIDVDAQLGDADIEYQRGKFPAGYKVLDEALLDLMQGDYYKKALRYGEDNLLESKLKDLGLGTTAINKIAEAVLADDEATWRNVNKASWNTWMNKLVNYP